MHEMFIHCVIKTLSDGGSRGTSNNCVREQKNKQLSPEKDLT